MTEAFKDFIERKIKELTAKEYERSVLSNGYDADTDIHITNIDMDLLHIMHDICGSVNALSMFFTEQLMTDLELRENYKQYYEGR